METTASQDFPAAKFADVLSGNQRYTEDYAGSHLTGTARKGLAIVTCMDSRIDPLEIVGMAPGDVKILRNAGARVTDDVLRTLVLATYLLGVDRVLVMPHLDCKMASADEETIHTQIWDNYGMNTRSIEIRTVSDQSAALRRDVTRIRSYPFLPKELAVAGVIFDVATGKLEVVPI
jgi:carbonic anhydrase